MKWILLLWTSAVPACAATLAHHDFDNLPVGSSPGMISVFDGQTVGLMPGTGSRAMLMTANEGFTLNGFEYSQVQIPVARGPGLLGGSGRFELSFDFLLRDMFWNGGPPELYEELTVFFDMPSVSTVSFGRLGSSGQITMFNHQSRLGNFTFDTLHNFRAVVDVDAGTWSAWFDGVKFLQDSPLREPQYLRSVRLSLRDEMSLPGEPQAWIDNIVLRSIPEPSAAGLMLLSAFLPACRRCRR